MSSEIQRQVGGDVPRSSLKYFRFTGVKLTRYDEEELAIKYCDATSKLLLVRSALDFRLASFHCSVFPIASGKKHRPLPSYASENRLPAGEAKIQVA